MKARLFLFGAGNVGRHLLAQLPAAAAHAARRDGLDLALIGVANRRGAWLSAEGLALAPGALPAGEPTLSGPPAALWDAAIARGADVIVDASALPDAAPLYARALAAGVSIATANKIPLTGDLASWQRLQRAARESAGSLEYETTVGADLPVIAPLVDRLRSGDEVLRVEGSLSGTLGYLSDAVTRGVPLLEAVEAARARGLTEPDPLEDLMGRDVARKALILARELGLPLELGDVALEPFLPEALIRLGQERGLAAALGEARWLLEPRVRVMAATGKALRYLATVQPDAVRPLRVGPVEVDAGHPSHALEGTEALIAITTRRIGSRPLVVRGPGAGGAVTASGLLADVVRAARSRAAPR